MKDNEIRNEVQRCGHEALTDFIISLGGHAKGNEFIIPFAVEDKIYYYRLKGTCAQWKDTATRKAFDPNDFINS